MSVDIQWRRIKGTYKNWSEILNLLGTVKEEGGIINLKRGEDVFSLEVDKVAKTYFPILDPVQKGPLRFYYNSDKDMTMVDFDGVMQSAALLTDDFDLILRLTKEFFETGDVKCMVPEDALPEVLWEG